MFNVGYHAALAGPGLQTEVCTEQINYVPLKSPRSNDRVTILLSFHPMLKLNKWWVSLVAAPASTQ